MDRISPRGICTLYVYNSYVDFIFQKQNTMRTILIFNLYGTYFTNMNYREVISYMVYNRQYTNIQALNSVNLKAYLCFESNLKI